MRQQALATLLIVAAACGDPQVDDFVGIWRLTAVNDQPLPVTGNNTAGETWVAAVLQINGETGLLDRCLAPSSTSTPSSRPTYLIVAPISDNRITLSYFDQRAPIVPDTASIRNSQLILRYAHGFDVLTFIPLPGPLPAACTLAQ
jgi:hypothetical protein